jgi:hypothetical protein
MRTRGVGARRAIVSLAFTVGAMAVFCAPRLAAQSVASQSPTPTLPPALRAAVDRLADSARTLGVPTEPLYLKAAEGVLKGASDDRVASVVSRLLGELREARRGLGADATSAELVAGASVIHAGMDVDALRRVGDARQRQRSGNSLVMPLVVLADLVARHVTPEIATASVTALAARGAPDREFASLRALVEREIGRGQPPDAATRTRTDIILRGISAGERQDGRPTVTAPLPRP